MSGRRPGGDRGLPATVDESLRAHAERVWLHPVDADGSVAVTLGTSPPAHHVAVEQYAVLPSVSAPGDRSSPAARMPTNAEAQSTTVTSAAPRARRSSRDVVAATAGGGPGAMVGG